MFLPSTSLTLSIILHTDGDWDWRVTNLTNFALFVCYFVVLLSLDSPCASSCHTLSVVFFGFLDSSGKEKEFVWQAEPRSPDLMILGDAWYRWPLNET